MCFVLPPFKELGWRYFALYMYMSVSRLVGPNWRTLAPTYLRIRLEIDADQETTLIGIDGFKTVSVEGSHGDL